jgi:hypothetical protein
LASQLDMSEEPELDALEELDEFDEFVEPDELSAA